MFGPLERSKLPTAVIDMMQELDKQFSSEKWLFKKMKQARYKAIKIIEGIYLIYVNQAGVEMCLKTKSDVIQDIEFYNDQPRELKLQLKRNLMGEKFEETIVFDTISEITR
jgi:hypothetical protein